MDWKSSRCLWIVVRDHEEIEVVLSIFFNDTLINKSTRSWINGVAVLFLKKSGRDLLVNKDVENFWIVPWCKLFNSLSELSTWTFFSQSLLSHGWTTNAISINDNLFWLITFVLLDIVIKGLFHEVLEDNCSVSADLFLLVIFGDVTAISLCTDHVFMEVLVVNLAEVLSGGLGV